MIWYFPLQTLKLRGYELFALAYVSPLILISTSIWKLVNKRGIILLLRLITLGGIASYQTPNPVIRVVYCSVWGFLTFYFHFLLLAIRIWFTSLNPVWHYTAFNAAILSLGVIVTLDRLHSDFQKYPLETEGRTSRERKACFRWTIPAAAYGSLLFLTHWIFGEVSLVSRWAVSGHPRSGPDPNPCGGIILLALAIGMMLSFWPNIINKISFWLIGVASAIGIFCLRREEAFVSGTMLSIYTMSLWPHMVERMIGSGHPGKVLGTAMLVYVLEMLATVWCTAYNFVPGGVIAREKTGVILGKLLWLFVGIGLLGLGLRFQVYQKKLLNQPVKKVFSAMIWSCRFGIDNQGWSSLEKSAKLIKQTDADFITILESDSSKPYLGNNDLTMWLGEKLGFYTDFGPSTKDHTWGEMTLSRYPIIQSTHHLLPSPHGELAPAISMTVNISGNLVDFVVAHFGNKKDELDRNLQAEYTSNLLKESQRPLVFLGYINSVPGSRNYIQLLKIGNVKDIANNDPFRWCEYIMYRDLIRLGFARISHGGLSDTEIQMARFQIPNDSTHFLDHDRLEVISKHVCFFNRFGSFKMGHNREQFHHYHMNTPKYFLLENF
uniref:PGAP2-interacting protein n=1 Tax=Callorhinchus milii TaxID=7868 RepID=A0A4W3ILB2_CALMI